MQKKLKVCIVGCGRIATLNVLGYKDNPHAEIYAVCDVSFERAAALAKAVGIDRVYTDYQNVLDDPAIDVIELLTPHNIHCQMTVAACEAKKHVSVQKPMAMSLAECDRMIAAAKANGVRLKVYENFVFYPPYVQAKQMIEEGAIGEPLSIRLKMNAGNNRHGWHVDQSSWAWRMQEEVSGGGELVFDDGNHKFSIARYFMGEPDTVFAFIGKTMMEGENNQYVDKKTGKTVNFYQDAPSVIVWKYRDSEKFGVFDITYSKDLEINSDYYACDERVEITGTKGVLWVTRCTGKMLQVPTLMLYRDGRMTSFHCLRDDWSDSFIDSTKDFVKAIAEGKPHRTDGYEGRRVLKFSLAALRAGSLNHPVTMDEMENEA